MTDALALIAPLFALILIGFVFAKRGWITPEGVAGLSAFLINLAIPALLFSAVYKAVFAGGLDLRLVAGYFLAAFATFVIAALLSRYVFKTATDAAAVAGFTSTFSNAALLGVPLISRAYGDIGLATISLILAFHAPLLFTWATLTIETHRAQGAGGPLRITGAIVGRLLRNPIVLGAASGGICGALGVDLPQLIDDFLDLLRDGATPAALFAVGAQLVGFSIAGDLKHTLVLVATKIVLFPSLAAGAILLIADPHPVAFAAAVTTAALPAGVNPTILAQMYGVLVRRAAGAMVLSTIVTALTITALIVYFKSGAAGGF